MLIIEISKHITFRCTKRRCIGTRKIADETLLFVFSREHTTHNAQCCNYSNYAQWYRTKSMNLNMCESKVIVFNFVIFGHKLIYLRFAFIQKEGNSMAKLRSSLFSLINGRINNLCTVCEKSSSGILKEKIRQLWFGDSSVRR